MRTLIISERRLRAMYAGGRGNPAARRFARLWASVFGLGLQPRRWVTLEVTGRRSGRVARFPLGMADWHGQWYLVSMLGEGCNWVQNVRAADGRAVLRRRRTVTCQLAEVPVAERPAIIRRYLEKVPGGRPHTTEFLAGKRVAVTGVSRTPQGHGRYASKPAASAVAGEVRA